MAKDKISSLTTHLFLTLDRLNDTDISAEELDKEIKRAETITKVSCEIVKVAKVSLEAKKLEADYLGNQQALPDIFQPESTIPVIVNKGVNDAERKND